MKQNQITLTDQEIINEESSYSHNDFRSHVGGGWENVYPPVRARMNKLLTSPSETVFKGKGVVRCSKIGWCFAQFCRLLGSPLFWKQGNDTALVVKVVPTPNGLRCWHRSFEFADGTTQIVKTTKVVDSKLGFLDAVGEQGEKMLATKMDVWTKGKSLHFKGTRYFLRLGLFNLPIPNILTPGTLRAEHKDLGNGNFQYILSFKHPIWGETFYQDGIFREES